MTKTTSVINLIIITIAIILVYSVKYKHNEDISFSNIKNQTIPQNAYPYIPQNYNYYFPGVPTGPTGPENSYLNSQPLLFPNQLYPKNPYFPQAGQSCLPDNVMGCGAMGVCVNNVCQVKSNENGTVFNIPLV